MNNAGIWEFACKHGTPTEYDCDACAAEERAKQNRCDLCPAPATIRIYDMDGIIVSELCADCHKRTNTDRR